MDSGLKVHKVSGVVLEGLPGTPARLVDLHLTPHHTILIHSTTHDETWISHSLLLSLHLYATATDAQARTPLVIRGRDFASYRILFSRKADAKMVYESLEAVIAKRLTPEHLYAFCDTPSQGSARSAGWNVYDPKKEYGRMGVFDTPTSPARTQAWRFTNVNATYEYCPTYPANLVVPAKISDTTLNYGKAYRSKARIAGLVYLHWNNLGSITRASQPMVGLKNNRSIQDEKLIEAIFTSHSYHSTINANMSNASYISHSNVVFGATSSNLIIDARPTTNAMANVAKGAGTENMEYYRNCRKVYLGIDNIHVMRDSLARVAEAIRQPDNINYDLLRRSNWLKHLSCILEGTVIIVRAVHLANSHVLVHCSDGWDRTSQLSAISQICLDPYYRTMEGFAVLIEKDWVSFGHKFGDRCGHLVPARVQCVCTMDDDAEEIGFLASMQQKLQFSGSSHAFKETCPVFDQYLDCVHQLMRQFPKYFEFNDAFLLELQKQAYECKYGNFIFNSEKERSDARASHRTRSIWADLLEPVSRGRYYNPSYARDNREVLFPEPRDVQWWTSWFKHADMNNAPVPRVVGLPGDPIMVEGRSDDPVLSQALPATTSAEGQQTPAGQVASTMPLGFDTNVAMTQASTAVQGAMKSAWSAWKSVKQGYEDRMKETSNAAPSGTPGSASHEDGFTDISAMRRSTSVPSSRTGTPRASSPVPEQAKTPRRHADSTEAKAETPSKTFRSDAGSHDNPWRSTETGDGVDADPLGVKVWS